MSRQHVVPGEVFAAVMTSRPEMIKLLRARVLGAYVNGVNTNPGVLSRDEMEGMLALVEESVEVAAKDRAKRTALAKQFRGLAHQVRGLQTMLERFYDELEAEDVIDDGESGEARNALRKKERREQ